MNLKNQINGETAHVNGQEVSILAKFHLFPNLSTDSMQSNLNPNKLYWGDWQTDSKVYMERQKTQNSQLNTKGEE